jgi:hypothetical protein
MTFEKLKDIKVSEYAGYVRIRLDYLDVEMSMDDFEYLFEKINEYKNVEVAL